MVVSVSNFEMSSVGIILIFFKKTFHHEKLSNSHDMN